MSATVRLSGKLPKDEDTNGLDDLHAELVDDPQYLHLAVVWFDASKVTHDVDGHEDVPTVRIRRIEPITGVDENQLRVIAAKAFAERTGRRQLPYEGEEALELFDEGHQ